MADVDQLDQSEHRVTLMTLHSAKGLEFENVYLSGMEDGLFPSYMTITSDDSGDLEEERRLCYVGITRAKKHLTLTSARIRMVNGETRYCKNSRFIEEIPEEFLQSGRLEPRLSGGNVRQRLDALAEDESLPWNQSSVLKGVSRFGSKSESYGTGISKENAYASKTYQLADGKVGFGKTFAVEKSKGLDYQTGDRVRHVKFGCGVVQEIKDGAKDYEVTVCFDTAGVKRMFASFAKLEKL